MASREDPCWADDGTAAGASEQHCMREPLIYWLRPGCTRFCYRFRLRWDIGWKQ